MTLKSFCSLRVVVLSRFFGLAGRAVLIALAVTMLTPVAQAGSPVATTTTLTISSTSVPYKTPILLTATVTAGGSPVSAGMVLFCDATAAYCENNSALGFAQLTATQATAVLKIGSGPLGAHSYKAIFLPNNSYATSVSNTVTYSVVGTYASTVSVASTGSVGNYTLSSTVVGVGSLITAPTGTVSFLDTSAGNNVLGTQPLGSATLSDVFTQAPNSPFAIGTATGTGSVQNRSVAIASAYLDGDNNLDVVTGDAYQTISVMLGKGDGSFQPKVNYPGCLTGVAMKILMADFNRDGNPDIALGCSDGSAGGLVILLGNGDGTFRTPVQYASGDVAGMAMGDFNGDGLLDFVVTDRYQSNVTMFLGNGDGTFQSGVILMTPASKPHNIVVADLNGDGKDDLAFAVDTATPASTLSDLYVALGNGDGTFKTPTMAASKIGEFLTAGDTNADNLTDIISTTITLTVYVANNMWVLTGNGDGTFKTPVSYISDIPSDPHLADVNSDGKPDIIAGGSYGALVYLGNGDGTFQPYSEPIIGGFLLTYAVNAGDYNNDGNADLIGTDASTPRAAVALSEVQQTVTAAALAGVALFPLGSGTHNVDASYSGDTRYTSGLSTTIPLLAAPTPTTLTLAVVPSSATLTGQSITLTATLSPYTVGPPTTTTDGEAVKFYNGATLIGTGTLASGVATMTTTTLPAGTNALKAVFGGDANYNSSTSGTVSVSVSSILIASSLNPSTYGQAVTFTATVAAGETGYVTFKDGGTVLGASAISGTTATFTTSALGVGTHTITGLYSGDGTHSAAVSPMLSQEVDKATPTMTVGTSGPSTYGGNVTITSTLPAGASGTVTFVSGGTTLGTGTVSGAGTTTIVTSVLPTGSDPITVTYSGDASYNTATAATTQTVAKATPVLPAPVATPSSPVIGSSVTITEAVPSGVSGPVTFYNGSTVLGTSAVVGGVATVTTSSLPLGGNSITASTPGDTNNNPATSPATVVTVIKITPTVTVTTSGSSTYGSPVTITATVPTGTTGTVTVTSGGVTLGTGTVNSTTGTVTITTSSLPVGSDPITASYGGDTNNYPATGSTVEVISKATPTVTVTTSGPSTYGSSVTITATVPIGVTGTVTFTSGGVTLGAGTVNSTTGTVAIATTALPAGSDTITASYGGDGNYNPATGTAVEVVSKFTPTITVSTSGPSIYGNSVTITATLPTGITGTVTFTSGGVTLGTGTVNSSTGVATIATSVLPVGSDTITASYGGDANNNSVTGTAVQVVSKVTPVVTVTTSGPSTYGSPVTITTTVPTGTTGTVTVTSGGVTLGSGTVSSAGTVTITTSSLPVGSDPITASYGGDANNNPATGSTVETVSKVTPVVTVTTSGPSTYGGTVTITAAVPPGTTGTVTVTSGGVTLGTGTVDPTTGTVTVTTTSLPVGSDPITASYGGDTNNNPATGSTVETVSKVTPVVTVTTSGPSTYGGSVTITTTVPPGTTGTVTVTSGGVTLGTGTVNPTTGTVTITTTSLPAGSDPITATYSGDTNNNGGTGSTTQTVGKTTPSSTLTSSQNPSTVGGSVTFTDTLPTSATGTVTFTSGGTTLGTGTITNGVASVTTTKLPAGSDPIVATYNGDTNNNTTTASLTQSVNKSSPTLTVTTSGPSTYGGTVTITAGVPVGATGTVTITSGGVTLGTGTVNPTTGTVAITTTTLPVGNDPITASYGGDSNYNPAAGSTTQTVSKGTPGVTLSSSANPATATQPVTFTAVVPSSATGTVTFYDGSTVLGVGTITNGVATVTATSLSVGSHTVTAVYSGDGSNNTATSAPLTQQVNKTTPVLVPPTSSTPTPVVGTPVTITEPIPSGATGPVTFYNGGTPLGTVPVVGGVATITVPSLPLGANPITVVVPGGPTTNPVTSPVGTVTVIKGVVTVTLTTSNNPASLGQAVMFTAVTTAGATGTVTFMDGATVLGVGTVNGAGIATLTTSSLATGSHPITAVYGGDTSYATATSAVLTEVIAKNASGITLTESSPEELLGTTVTFTATVTTASPTPSGSVTFFDGGIAVGTAPLSTNGSVAVSLATSGTAAYATSTMSAGTHQITAVYSGDNSFAGSSSLPLSNVVEDFTVTAKGTASQNLFPGKSTSYTYTVAPVGASTFLSDLNLQVTGLPTGATYTLTPAMIKAGSGATDVVLDVQTSSSMTAQNQTPRQTPGQRRELPIALGMLGLAGLGAIRRHRKQMPRMLMLALLCVASLLPVAALTGCAGGYFALTPTTYSITVTGMEGSIQHSATATLVVQ